MPDPTPLFQRFLTLLDTDGTWRRLPEPTMNPLRPAFMQDDLVVSMVFDMNTSAPKLTRLKITNMDGDTPVDLLDHPLPCSHLDLYRPERLLERIQRGAGARGRFAWARLEQILTGSILTTEPTATGTWDVGLHPDVQSASGPTDSFFQAIQFASIYASLDIESVPFDLPRLLREFQQTIGPVRISSPAGLHTPLSLSIEMPTEFEDRLQALDAVHETAHCPDLFVTQD